MIEILNLAPYKRYPNYVANTVMARGTMCYVEGVATDGQQLVNYPLSTGNAKRAYYMVDKIWMSDEFGNDADAAIDNIAKGAGVAIYGAGEFATNKFDWPSLGTAYAGGGSRWANTSTANTYSGNYWKAGLGTAIASLGGVQPRPLWVTTCVAAGTRKGFLTATCPAATIAGDNRVRAIQGYFLGVWTEAFTQSFSSTNPWARVRTIETNASGL